MNLPELWSLIQRTGIEITLEGDHLVAEGDERHFTEDLDAALLDHKASLLTYLGPRPPKPSAAPYDDEPMPTDSPWPSCTFGDVRAGIAREALMLGLGHAGLNEVVRRVTGRASLWGLGLEDLIRVDEVIQALIDEKEKLIHG